MKKNLAELKAKAAERRAKMRELSKTISALSDADRAQLFAGKPVFTIERRPLSPFNTKFVLSQFEGASIVGGFRQWKEAGRSVKKGAVGLGIWIPAGNRADGETLPTATADQAPDGEEKSRSRFVIGYVFDITQTEETTQQQPQEEPAAQPAREQTDAAALHYEDRCAALVGEEDQ